jgi:hypothetical protein
MIKSCTTGSWRMRVIVGLGVLCGIAVAALLVVGFVVGRVQPGFDRRVTCLDEVRSIFYDRPPISRNVAWVGRVTILDLVPEEKERRRQGMAPLRAGLHGAGRRE